MLHRWLPVCHCHENDAGMSFTPGRGAAVLVAHLFWPPRVPPPPLLCGGAFQYVYDVLTCF